MYNKYVLTALRFSEKLCKIRLAPLGSPALRRRDVVPRLCLLPHLLHTTVCKTAHLKQMEPESRRLRSWHVWMTFILSTYYNKHLGKNNKCHLAYKQKQWTDVTSVCQRRCAWDIPMALAAIRNTTGMHTDVNICISWCFSSFPLVNESDSSKKYLLTLMVFFVTNKT